MWQVTEYLDRDKTRMRSLYNLVTHRAQAEQDEDYQLKTAVGTIFFLSLLEQNFWFEEFSSEGWTGEKAMVAGLLHHLLGVAKFNTHQTGQFDSFDLATGYTATAIGQVAKLP